MRNVKGLFIEELERRAAPAAMAGLIHASEMARAHANPNAGLAPVYTTLALGEETGGGVWGDSNGYLERTADYEVWNQPLRG